MWTWSSGIAREAQGCIKAAKCGRATRHQRQGCGASLGPTRGAVILTTSPVTCALTTACRSAQPGPVQCRYERRLTGVLLFSPRCRLRTAVADQCARPPLPAQSTGQCRERHPVPLGSQQQSGAVAQVHGGKHKRNERGVG
jgi:hypothetical protein